MKMKKSMILLVCFLLLTTMPLTVSAEETGMPQENPVKITVASGTAFPGREITLPISIEGNPGFTNLAILLEYDESKLELKSIDTGASDTTYLCGMICNSSNTAWEITQNTTGGFLVAASADAVTEDGKLYTATFRVKDAVSVSTSVTANVLYLRSNAGNPLEFRSLATEVTDGTVHVILPGDVTGGTDGMADGIVEYNDVMAVYQVLQSEQKVFPQEEQMLVADLNQNGYIDADDVTRIYNIYLGGN